LREATSKRVRETEAEAVAFIVGRAIELDTNMAAQDYISLHAGDKALVVESLEEIQKAADQIPSFLTEEDSSSAAPPC
jgi:uncharacterized transporter YbjL